MNHAYTDTDRLNYVLNNCTIKSKYVPLRGREYTRDDIDAFLAADDIYQAAEDKKLEKQQEQAQAYKENQ